MKIVAVSGGFDPVHIGHINYFKQASKIGKVVVILNSDRFLIKKKGYFFMKYQERKKILESIKYVYKVIPCIDRDQTVSKTLAKLRPDIFAKGGDRILKNIPKSEIEICNKLKIKMIFMVGGKKIQSSSKLCQNLKFYGLVLRQQLNQAMGELRER